MAKDYIRDFYGRILGSYEEDSYGRIILRDFHGRILGKYDPKENKTRDFYGRIVGQGNTLARLLK